ncbi:hypothetical protein CUMW_157940 [Citrus unshiu]|uniref:Uncharacterized protein n=1 Tax=Citrus unshiu TaxID=55188 RepID=A0A2H5PQF1_CITUN|nr:hypothetical protein CUMW_157940 [Citrus unshiu]
MTCNPRVSSCRRNNRKANLTAPSSVRHILMSALLFVDLRKKVQHKVNVGGTYKGQEGKFFQVHHRKWPRNTFTSSASLAGRLMDPHSECGNQPMLHLDKDMKSLLHHKAKGHAAADKEKGTGYQVHPRGYYAEG